MWQQCDGTIEQPKSAMCQIWNQNGAGKQKINQMRFDGFCGEEICYELGQCKRSECDQCQVGNQLAIRL